MVVAHVTEFNILMSVKLHHEGMIEARRKVVRTIDNWEDPHEFAGVSYSSEVREETESKAMARFLAKMANEKEV